MRTIKEFRGDAKDIQDVEVIEGNVLIYGTMDLPNLKKIGGDAFFYRWQGSAPVLKTIGGGANFQGWQGSAPVLETIGGYADFYDWQGSAPVLETIGGYANFGGWQGSAPKLKKIGGVLYINKDSFFKINIEECKVKYWNGSWKVLKPTEPFNQWLWKFMLKNKLMS